MKKSTFLLFILCLVTLTSCRITKTITMINAKAMATETETEFIKNKISSISFLELSEDQEVAAISIWKEEKTQLGRINLGKNSEIAPIIFKSENNFRSILTPEQLKTYKGFRDDSTILKYFMSDRSMKEIKRIYEIDEEIL
ncbi:hypothetical protein MH928_11025 [Flavobacterium sp. WW92]|uniref:hypothetical protein n=1 Tax=unclassified Flavobacterium TaxID=196869 RepID=UPI0022254D05|nr:MULTISPECIES: hypothetical protein [unclassified Flavobacterium]WDO11861.1 hypothetical protein MH928_11025 [Flavobacterium sp. WW92]